MKGEEEEDAQARVHSDGLDRSLPPLPVHLDYEATL